MGVGSEQIGASKRVAPLFAMHLVHDVMFVRIFENKLGEPCQNN
jgi:hypothetical protein